MQNSPNKSIKSIPLTRFFEYFDGTQTDTLGSDRAYENVGWFRRAVDIRSHAVQTMPYCIMQDGDELYTEAPDQELPPELNVLPLMGECARDLDLYGTFYAVYETNQFGMNGKWRRLAPASITPIFNIDGLQGFRRSLGSKQIIYKPDELLYIWVPDTKTEIGHGKGFAHAALMAATALHNIEVFQGKFFEQGALNPTIVTIEGYDLYPEQEQKRIKTTFEKLMSGVKNAFKIFPVGRNVSAVNLMQPLRDMGMQELTTSQRETIATTLGIPQSLLMSNAANFATATQDDLNFYDKAIVPLCDMIEDQLNERLFSAYGLRLEYQEQRLEVYQAIEQTKSEKLNGMLDRGVIDVNEYRELIGLPPKAMVIEDVSVTPVTVIESDSTTQPTLPAGDIVTIEADTEPLRDALDKWKRFAVKRLKEGHPEKMQSFDNDAIPALLSEAIKASLESAYTTEDIKAVFVDARAWERHYA